MLSNWAQSSNNVNLASFAVSLEIAKRGKPFTDSEYVKDCFIRASEELFRDFKNKAEIMKKIKDLPLSAKMSSNVTHMQVEDIQLASALSLAIDKSCDIKDTSQVTLFVRYMSSQGPKEEKLGLLPLSGQTRGEDIANAVQKCLEDYGIDINKIVSIATDGARSMTGIHRGVTSILQKNKRRNSNVSLHNSSRSALCPNISGRNSRGHELEVTYCNTLAKSLSEIKTFLNEKSIDHPELEEDKWLQKFNFMVDTTMKLNELNLNLQGKGNPAYALLEDSSLFRKKITSFVEDMESGKLLHFKNLKQYRDETNATIDTNYFSIALKNMKDGFA
ncbi:hypothetical protein AVEN_23610-1 [Araneus ventricosus]|uniref:Uncharacterized protein n=1 Tax=Araneus ventricosus TaxID=182803 RepID=A0A4Y2BHX1_ARAVE|nr:hypothetical protein AVEN_23610-1 [Araneus ventricosus]